MLTSEQHAAIVEALGQECFLYVKVVSEYGSNSTLVVYEEPIELADLVVPAGETPATPAEESAPPKDEGVFLLATYYESDATRRWRHRTLVSRRQAMFLAGQEKRAEVYRLHKVPNEPEGEDEADEGTFLIVFEDGPNGMPWDVFGSMGCSKDEAFVSLRQARFDRLGWARTRDTTRAMGIYRVVLDGPPAPPCAPPAGVSSIFDHRREPTFPYLFSMSFPSVWPKGER